MNMSLQMGMDMGVETHIQTIAISTFKATCLAVLEQVNKTKQPVLVTRFGKPVAQIVPPPPVKDEKPFLGRLEGTGIEIGDIVSPLDPEDWGSLGWPKE
jgi:prevent-host-death family protein